MPALWRRTLFNVVVRRGGWSGHPHSLPHRLRGAFGHALLRDTSPDAAQARALFFGPLPQWRPRSQLPRPFLIQTDDAEDELHLRLVLFGFAGRWRDAAFDAFLAAITGGIALDDRPGAPRRALDIISADWTRSESVAVPSAGLAARLRFCTPLQLGPRHTLGLRYADIIVSLAERLAGLAYWQGFRVEPDLSRWRDIGNLLQFDDAGLRPEAWERRSGAQDGRTIPMRGLIGHLDIIRPPESIMHLLALGETMHAGGGTALGLGRYDLL